VTQLRIPAAALDQHIAILGKTGAGKTFAAKSIVEHLLGQRRQVCVLDPTAAWWGLRLGADGKARGFDVVLLGGKHADIPLHERSGASVARLVTQQRASVVIDTSGMTVGEYTRWFIDFAGTLYTTISEPLHLVIDEAHYFMPQGKAPDVDAGRMLHAGNRLMSGGRSLGIRGLVITQRPAKFHKDSLTCVDTLIAMRVIAPQDRQAVKDWIDGAGDPEQGRKVLDSLARLQRGEGWVWYPEGGFLERVKFPRISTYDSSATPKHGAGSGPAVKEIDLGEIKAAMAEAVAEAEANDPKKLRAHIAALQKQLAGKAPPSADPAAIERAVAVAITQRDREWEHRWREVMALCQSHKNRLAKIAELAAVNGEAEHVQRPLPDPVPSMQRIIQKPHSPRPLAVASSPTPTEGLSGPEQRILDAIAWLEIVGITNPQKAAVAFIAGYRPGGGAFNNPLGRLRSAGRVRDLSLTDEGRQLARRPEAAPSIEALHQMVIDRLDGPEQRILRPLLESYPEPLTKEDLAEASGYAQGGGAFNNPLGRLRTLGLIDYPSRGLVVAMPVLFPETLT
jgi:uncharacterized protein